MRKLDNQSFQALIAGNIYKEMLGMKKKGMKSLIRKKQASGKNVAQCCAKISPVVAGCHD